MIEVYFSNLSISARDDDIYFHGYALRDLCQLCRRHLIRLRKSSCGGWSRIEVFKGPGEGNEKEEMRRKFFTLEIFLFFFGFEY